MKQSYSPWEKFLASARRIVGIGPSIGWASRSEIICLIFRLNASLIGIARFDFSSLSTPPSLMKKPACGRLERRARRKRAPTFWFSICSHFSLIKQISL